MHPGRWAITGGTVLDGLGGPGTPADLVVADGRIEGIEAPGTSLPSDLPVVDARGLTVAPGFIDVHSHADNAPFLDQDDTSKILQGVTTEIVGNCGFSLAPARPERADDLQEIVNQFFPAGTPAATRLEALLELTDDCGYVTNYAPLVGHGALRTGTIGPGRRDASTDDVAAMGQLLDEAVRAGAFGLSSGLIYAPGSFATPAELAALASYLPAGVPYATHIRGEGKQLRASIAEAVNVARQGTAVHVSHLKVAGEANWGQMRQVLEQLDAARAEGCDIRQDVYPYTAGSTILAAVLPPWTRDGGRDATLGRLTAPGAVTTLENDLSRDDGTWENLAHGSGWDHVVIASSASGRFDGSSIAAIAAGANVSAVQAVVDLLVEEELEATMIIHSMCEPDLREALVHPATMIGSDGLPPGIPGMPHPRQYGTFPRVLGRLARQDRWLTVEEAIRKMTSMPADAFGLADRGRIRIGHMADLVAFDESAILDTATYERPVQDPDGIAWVALAGRLVVADGRYLGERHGRRLTRS